MKPQLHVKNHFVPVFYLKNWVKPSGKLETYRLLVPHENVSLWKAQHPSSVGWQKHLYTKMVAGEENDEFEDWFGSEYESPAQPIIQKVIKDVRLTPEDWKILIRFLAVQDLRTPASLLNFLKVERENLDYLLKKGMKDTAEKMINQDAIAPIELGSNETVASYEDLPLKLSFHHEPEGLRIRAKTYSGRLSWLFVIQQTLMQRLDILLRQKWTILRPATGHNFLTSDSPVLRFIYKDNMGYKFTNNWEEPHSTTVFPLSPSHAMVGEAGLKNLPLKGARLSAFFTQEVNKMTVNNAHRYVFSHEVDHDVEMIKPRVVDKNCYLNEKKQIETWHARNKELEVDYAEGQLQIFEES